MTIQNLERRALCEAPGIPKQDWCCVCGRPATNMHHVVPRSAGGENGPTVPLCGLGSAAGCHALAHNNGGRLSFRYDEKRGMWWFVADDEAARAITRRGRRVRGGEHPCVGSTARCELVYEGEHVTLAAEPAPLADEPCTVSGMSQVDDLGARLDALRREAETNVALRNQLDYIIGGILREAREVYAATVPGRRAASQEYQSWVVDTLHMSKASVSRYELYAGLEDDSAADLGISLGYEVARVVKDGIDTKESAIAAAKSMSVRDFKSHYRPRDESPTCKIVCPLDGSDCVRKSCQTTGVE